MRDDQVVPSDHDTSDRPNSVPGRRQNRVDETSPNDQADGTSADSPAGRSAIAYPADIDEPGLTDDELALYRRRVAEGLYNSREIADEVARRMMRRGDI